MTNIISNLSNRATIAVLTLLFSATMVLGAVGPAYTGPQADQQVSALDKAPATSSDSLA